MDQYESRIGRLIKLINTSTEQRVNAIVSQYNLTSSQSEVIMYLHKCSMCNKKNVTQRDIEREFHISNPTVTGLLNRLEAKGFIERVVSFDDARCKYITLTDKSNLILEQIRNELDAQETDMVAGLTDKEVKDLKQILSKVLKNL